MEKPIIFSTEMVRAILESRKTQTRRVIKPQPEFLNRMEGNRSVGLFWNWKFESVTFDCWNDMLRDISKFCFYGNPGDQLWVRESFCLADINAYTSAKKINPNNSNEAAFFKEDWWREKSHPKWKPPIFMPRWASRITLEIVSIRPERLQDISEANAQAEGIDPHLTGKMKGTENSLAKHYRSAYTDLWDRINEKRGFGWEMNPWVWVIEFRRVE